jgi:hypothetical protein
LLLLLNNFFNTQLGYFLALHKYFKFDGSTQGLPICYLYANVKKNRFDWVKNANNSYVQIGALVECTIFEQTKLYVIGFCCTENGVKASSSYPLPRIKYLMTGNKYLPYMTCDTVDSISEPVAVIPTSLRLSSYFIKKTESRSHEIFCVIPVGFLFRDDWGDSTNDQLTRFHERLLTKFHLREYFNDSQKNKNSKFTKLIDTMKNIGKNDQHGYRDEDVIEEVIELRR